MMMTKRSTTLGFHKQASGKMSEAFVNSTRACVTINLRQVVNEQQKQQGQYEENYRGKNTTVFVCGSKCPTFKAGEVTER
eukprot:m.40868 g.40868  ORF g.40868 m.40868 type:complete len:80 (+) comp10477_c1_seq1:68-307(+)